jgi:phosphoglycerate dehydrogenase-like enzyme
MPVRILMASQLFEAVMDVAREILPPGYELVVAEFDSSEFAAALRNTEYYIGSPRFQLGPEFYRAAPRLKLVQLFSAGYDRLDVEAARQAGVPICNNGGSNSVAVAEHALLLMLAVSRRLVWQHENVVAGRWRGNDFSSIMLYELEDKMLGIVGLGNIGKKVARLAQAFHMRVQYYDVARLSGDAEDALGVRFALFPELLRSSDIVTLHVPLDASTHKLIAARELGLMKPTAILINTCRGPVVDEDALYDALISDRIRGAGLDVMVEEPPAPEHKLFTLPNIILTPHMAGPSWENWKKAFRNSFDNIERVARGEKPLWIIPELRG